MRHLLAIVTLSLWPVTLVAQDAPAPVPAATAEETARDRSYLTGLIEDNLSGAGRAIRLEGFAGALSSRATFTSLTIADDMGVWLTITDGALAWSRGALLTGRLEIEELSAKNITLARLPQPVPDPATPEVKPFALPELPVSVRIGKLHADRLDLGAPVLGQAVALALDGGLELKDGAGAAKLNVLRLDGPRGRVDLNASYANATRVLSLDLLLDEAEGGIAAHLIGLPDEPAVQLAASGAGPLSDFATDIVLSTQGVQRVTGRVALRETVTSPEAMPTQGFDLAISGDIDPLLPAEYRGFFGPDAQIAAVGQRAPSGVLDLSTLRIDGAALDLQGSARVLPSGLPDRADLSLQIGTEGVDEVLLPLSGSKTWLRRADLSLGFDAAKSDGWTLDGRITRLRQADLSVFNLRLNGSGRIGRPAGGAATVGGRLTFTASGIETADPALAQAIGPFATGKATFFWRQAAPLSLPAISVIGRGYALDGRLSLDNLAEGGDLSGAARLRHSDVSALSGLAGRALGGAVEGQIFGRYRLLTGAFDAEAAVTGRDLSLDQPQADGLLRGTSRITVSALRDESGLVLRAFEATAQSLTATAQGKISSESGAITGRVELADLSVLGRGYRGRLASDVALRMQDGGQDYTLEATAAGLGLGQPQIDAILAGQSRFSLSAGLREGRFGLNALALETPQLRADVRGTAEGALRRFGVSARLANAALLAPGFPGPVTLGGTVVDDGGAYRVDLNGTGPGGTSAAVQGQVGRDFARVDLGLRGRAETALANAFIAPQSINGPLNFDLRMSGAPRLAALSGQVIATGGRLAAPTLGMALEDIAARADIAGGRTQLRMDGRLGTGGQIGLSGPITLSAPYAGDLRLTLDRARLRDPDLYDTRVSGDLTISGPLTGGARISGALTLSDTELRVPSGAVEGVGTIPEIAHLNETAAQRETRLRAGLIRPQEGESAGSGSNFPLDVTISAPSRIFVRGRGLDAELDGALRVTGTTANVVPIGEFGLIRGRLDVLAKRFTLDEGQIALQGALVPWILFRATTEQDDYAITLSLEGAATAPELRITSSPELPEEEVLARLLFDKGLSNLSALQAAQLASAVASLAGKGGAGLLSKLRQGTGLDDLDVGTDAEGNAALRAGKYLSERVYTDVAIDSQGKTEINLNLDVTKSVTARGSVGSDGSGGIGIFLERDY